MEIPLIPTIEAVDSCRCVASRERLILPGQKAVGFSWVAARSDEGSLGDLLGDWAGTWAVAYQEWKRLPRVESGSRFRFSGFFTKRSV
ncbi:MAG: hypothetical protein R3B96_14510 [Pirellulaceae bacterium]